MEPPSIAPSAPPPSHHTGATAAVIVVVVVLVGAGLWYGAEVRAGHLGAPPPRTGPIDLLPSNGTASQCAIGNSSVLNATSALQVGSLEASTFNVPKNTTGQDGVCYNASNGSVLGYSNFSEVGGGVVKDGGSWFSYPEVTYGVDQWAGAYTTYTNQLPPWTLPQTVADVAGEDVWFTTSYSIQPPPSSNVTGYDLSFDDFFSQSLPPEFEMGPFVEVLILLDHNLSSSFFTWTNWSTPTLVNSSLSVQPWSVGDWCHHRSSSEPNGTLTFDFSFGSQATHGMAVGTLGVNLSAVLGEVLQMMPSVTCWTGPTDGFSSFYMDQANLGAEAGALVGDGLDYNWTLSDYCIHVVRGAPTAGNTSCVGTLSGSVAATPTFAPPLNGIDRQTRTREYWPGLSGPEPG